MTDNWREVWNKAYQIVPQQLEQVANVNRAVTAFNTNIDAVVKISGEKLTRLATKMNLQAADLQNPSTMLNEPRDVLRGIIKCFTQGIAEEWLSDKPAVYDWLQKNLGYDKLQMGGQAGIVANVLAVLGVKEVCAHTNSHPKIQAEQFLNLDNLLAIDSDGKARKAEQINRNEDEPLVHWIIEFAAGEKFEFTGKTYICPKANRFIATYDTANTELKINSDFINYVNENGFDYMILSGYHSLMEKCGGVEKVKSTVPLIERWKKENPQAIIHLELASTQDKAVRKAIITEIAPRVHSVGLNEREALDVLEIIAAEKFKMLQQQNLSAADMYQILEIIKEKLKTPRVQLHFLGMYLTLQNQNFMISPPENLRGMMLAATVAASKAKTGNIEQKENLLAASNIKIGDIAAENLRCLAEFLHFPQLTTSGIMRINNQDLIAVPTLIVKNPKTLVGMGDTISSVSLVGAR